jgi:DNA-binding CsgD family transcriptional regulator
MGGKASGKTKRTDAPRLVTAGASSGSMSIILDGVAAAIDSIGGTTKWHALAELITRVAVAEPPLICIFRNSDPPQVVSHGVKPEDMEIQIERYVRGPYVLDPFFTIYQQGALSGLYTLRHIAPDQLRQSQYFQEFYRYTRLLDEVCYLARLDDGHACVQVSVARFAGEKHFASRDIAALARIDPLVQALIRKNWASDRLPPPERTLSSRALEQFGRPALTAREHQVVGMILRGHSSKSAARALAISGETVRNHRKRIYRKLGVDSQAQLFAQFIESTLPPTLTAQ